MTDEHTFTLWQQDAPRAQGSLFDEAPAGKAESALLSSLLSTLSRQFATLDDMLGAARDPLEELEPGICTKCHVAGRVRKPQTVAYCPLCETYTVTAATVLAGER